MKPAGSISLGRWSEVSIYLHWTWVVICAYALFTDPDFALVYIGVFVIILLHEFGHCFAARRYGIVADEVLLWPLGGVAKIDISVEPKTELSIALAGPAVNLALMPIFFFLSGYNYWHTLGIVNIIITIFNLLPALPMDGGRVFRALLMFWLRDDFRSTGISVRISQSLCIVGGMFALYYGLYLAVVVSLFIGLTAQYELSAANDRAIASILADRTIYDSREAIRVIESYQQSVDSSLEFPDNM